METKNSIFKIMLLAIAMIAGSEKICAVNIIPQLISTAKNTPTGTSGWNITGAAVNITTPDYWKMLLGSSLETPYMNLSSYTSIQIALSLQSYGVTGAHSDDVKIEVWDGTNWSQVGVNLHTTSKKGTQTISLPYTLSSAKIRLTSPNATNLAGARIYSVNITGTDTTITPTHTVTSSTLSAFTSNYETVTPSAEQRFSVSGTNLTNNIIITAPTNYEIPTTTGSNFAATSPITLTQSGGTLPNPTIIVTEIGIPDFVAVIGNTDTETINISGLNLTDDISLALAGTNADQFSLSTNKVAQTSGTAPNTAVIITYTPKVQASHTATLTLSSGTTIPVIYTLNGTGTYVPLTTPVTTAANGISATGFTANWDAVDGATSYDLNVYTKTAGTAIPTNLFISEYVEGLSNNQAIEIYNGTGTSVDLSTYSLKKQTDGAGLYSNELVLSGTLANNDVYVIANTNANATILGLSDTNNNSTISFNGNDAVALFKNGAQIDEVGVFNETAVWGADLTTIRKSSISSPSATYNASEWDTQTTDYITNLGMHTLNGSTTVITSVSGYPITGLTDTFKTLTNLTPSTTYYYTVLAKNANVSSTVSNEMSVTTSAFTGFTSITSSLSVSTINGKMQLNATAGETVNIYNSVGQLLISKLAIEGLNTIEVSTRGVVIVKVGNRIAKVII